MTDEDNYCSICNGTGLGQCDEVNCLFCGGRGVRVDRTVQQEREEYMAELKWEEMQYGN